MRVCQDKEIWIAAVKPTNSARWEVFEELEDIWTRWQAENGDILGKVQSGQQGLCYTPAVRECERKDAFPTADG